MTSHLPPSLSLDTLSPRAAPRVPLSPYPHPAPRYTRPSGRTVDNSPLVPFFALFIVLWGFLFVRFWQRRTAALAYKWGTEDAYVKVTLGGPMLRAGLTIITWGTRPMLRAGAALEAVLSYPHGPGAPCD